MINPATVLGNTNLFCFLPDVEINAKVFETSSKTGHNVGEYH